MLVLALVVMSIPLFAGVDLTYDQLIQCKSAPCYGSDGDDKILERKGNGVYDEIVMKGDLVLANRYGNDTDIVTT